MNEQSFKRDEMGRGDKMRRIGLVVLAASAGLAFAGESPVGEAVGYEVDGAGFVTATMDVDISGISHWDAEGSPNNESLRVFVGRYTVITKIAWDVSLTTFNSSWASEAYIEFQGFGDSILLVPGINDAFPVSDMNYNSGGFVDLKDVWMQNLMADTDGYITLRFFDIFDDAEGEIDATWQAGSVITLGGYAYPAPGTLALLGIGGLVGARRRR